ncbi:MAG: hypothetical protein HQM13_06535 [SAR324 cluster bacterium]|nr:hypothetical protein [SAR324 cluster bacterium]
MNKKLNLSLTLIRLFCIWIVVWPFVTLILWAFRQLGLSWPLAAQTFVMTLIIVPMISLIVGPGVQRMLRKFI